MLESHFNKVANTSGGHFWLQCVFNEIPNHVLLFNNLIEIVVKYDVNLICCEFYLFVF